MTQVKTYISGFIIGSFACVGFAMPAFAAPSSHDLVPSAVTQQSFTAVKLGAKRIHVQYAQSAISPSKAKSIARKAAPGAEVVDISRKGNRYKVRMIRKDGRVVDIVIDAASGRVLN